MCKNIIRKGKNGDKRKIGGTKEEHPNIRSRPTRTFFKFLGRKQTDIIKTKEVYEKVKGEVKKRINLLIKSELNGENCILKSI